MLQIHHDVSNVSRLLLLINTLINFYEITDHQANHSERQHLVDEHYCIIIPVRVRVNDKEEADLNDNTYCKPPLHNYVDSFIVFNQSACLCKEEIEASEVNSETEN